MNHAVSCREESSARRNRFFLCFVYKGILCHIGGRHDILTKVPICWRPYLTLQLQLMMWKIWFAMGKRKKRCWSLFIMLHLIAISVPPVHSGWCAGNQSPSRLQRSFCQLWRGRGLWGGSVCPGLCQAGEMLLPATNVNNTEYRLLMSSKENHTLPIKKRARAGIAILSTLQISKGSSTSRVDVLGLQSLGAHFLNKLR